MDLPSIQPVIDYITSVGADLAVGAGSSALAWAVAEASKKTANESSHSCDVFVLSSPFDLKTTKPRKLYTCGALLFYCLRSFHVCLTCQSNRAPQS